IKNLRPVTFDWISSKQKDIGFVAEEVAEAEPLLATRNSDGQIEGVKYAQITTALVNAVKEQQAQIEKQQAQIEMLKAL
ncbi:tail fiber domain-containing protein, partial [Pseudomonas atacamensis]|uniref:tail fiber domain-containing protein n=1 Tax=Pseudomonas atacamensis TaxID=2565368 RepID=UPI002B1E5684